MRGHIQLEGGLSHEYTKIAPTVKLSVTHKVQSLHRGFPREDHTHGRANVSTHC